ncbi:MAG TPA: ATP-binding cassette domain-containing protein [Gemmatimonadaceae bacterium]|nr:ATP-binding cassette domain-containing protein [Gemmatimonadaceae bacterium]
MSARTDGGPALELRGIEKRFGDVVALAGVDLNVAQGSVHALLGENGAGKTTLMRIAYGLVPADRGEVRLFGTPASSHSVRGAVRAGVGMVQQQLSLAPNLSAAENLVLGRRGLFNPAAAAERLDAVSAEFGLRVPAVSRTQDLSIVEQQRLEILKALSRGARLIILDEPTALLAPSEVDDLLQWIRNFASNGGSAVLVTHKLREALAVADDVTVLRRGQVTRAGPAKDTSAQELAAAIFADTAADGASERSSDQPVPAASSEGAVIVEARDVTISRRVPVLRGASFVVRRHEIVGVAAVEGSGHRELLLALAGLLPITAGQLRTPNRIAQIPADRARDGLIPDFSLVENVALRGLGGRRGVMPWSSLAALTSELLRRFGIVAPSPKTPAKALSGGNQQRLVVARELEREVDLVVADNPTRGLDLKATAFVHTQLRGAAAGGAAVLIHSTDLDEILSLATRVLVVFHGSVREVQPERSAVGRAMLGAA